MDTLLWAFGTVFAALGIIASYFGIVDGWKKATADTDAHPKLAVNLELIPNSTRSVSVTNSDPFVPFNIPEGESITWEQRDKLIYFFDFKWNYLLHVSNVSSDVALSINLIPIVCAGITFITESDTKPNKPVAPNNTKSFTLHARKTHRYDAKEADAVLNTTPFDNVRIEYTNIGGIKCSTDYIVSTNKNTYNKYGANKYRVVLISFILIILAAVFIVLANKS